MRKRRVMSRRLLKLLAPNNSTSNKSKTPALRNNIINQLDVCNHDIPSSWSGNRKPQKMNGCSCLYFVDWKLPNCVYFLIVRPKEIRLDFVLANFSGQIFDLRFIT